MALQAASRTITRAPLPPLPSDIAAPEKPRGEAAQELGSCSRQERDETVSLGQGEVDHRKWRRRRRRRRTRSVPAVGGPGRIRAGGRAGCHAPGDGSAACPQRGLAHSLGKRKLGPQGGGGGGGGGGEGDAAGGVGGERSRGGRGREASAAGGVGTWEEGKAWWLIGWWGGGGDVTGASVDVAALLESRSAAAVSASGGLSGGATRVRPLERSLSPELPRRLAHRARCANCPGPSWLKAVFGPACKIKHQLLYWLIKYLLFF